MFFCYATLDLLGALHAGDATRGAPVAEQAPAYMRDFLGYTAEQATLLQTRFRHKLLHLAQPAPVVGVAGQDVRWEVDPAPAFRSPTAGPAADRVPVCFPLRVGEFAEDIGTSVFRRGGFLDVLARDRAARERFSRAMRQIEDPQG